MLKLIANVTALLMLIPPLAVAVAALGRLDHRAADLLVHFTAPALIATLGLTLGLLILRLYPAATIGGLVSLALLVANWPQWVPPKTAPDSHESFSVYSANLWVYNQDMKALARSIDRADADILILVELGATGREQADQLFADYPYRLYAGRGDHPAKSAILSRYPLSPVEGPKHRETVSAIAQTPLGPVTLIGAHLTRPWPYQPQANQMKQVDQLTELRRTLSGPLIMAGDFNAVSHGRIGRQIKQDMGLIPAPALLGTFPRKVLSLFGITIDQVWHTPDLSLISRSLGLPNGSDHRSVITRFSRAAPPQP